MEPRNLETAAARIVRRAMVVGAVPAVVLGVVLAVAVHVLVGLLVAVLVAGAWAALVRSKVQGAVRSVLVDAAAVPVDEESAPRLANVVDGLCVASGVTAPELWVVRAAPVNAMALAAGDRAAVVVTDGLVEELGLVALEGIVANLLGRLRDGSARLLTTAHALGSLPLAAVWLPERLVADALGEQYAVRSDIEAVRLTRYPPGLRAALRDAAATGTAVPSTSPDRAHLWLVPVVDDAAAGSSSTLRTTAQPLDLRIDVLDEL